MSHFAKVENGIVTEVIVAEENYINSGKLGDPSMWVQTSRNTRGGKHYDPDDQELLSDTQEKAFRKNYAGKGYTYDAVRDAFIPPKTVKGWVLNEETCLWEPPTPYPNDGQRYQWDLENEIWALYTGPNEPPEEI
jgi:hypothetical protein